MIHDNQEFPNNFSNAALAIHKMFSQPRCLPDNFVNLKNFKDLDTTRHINNLNNSSGEN